MRDRQMTREIKIKKIVQFMSVRRKWSIVQVKKQNKKLLKRKGFAAEMKSVKVHVSV